MEVLELTQAARRQQCVHRAVVAARQRNEELTRQLAAMEQQRRRAHSPHRSTDGGRRNSATEGLREEGVAPGDVENAPVEEEKEADETLPSSGGGDSATKCSNSSAEAHEAAWAAIDAGLVEQHRAEAEQVCQAAVRGAMARGGLLVLCPFTGRMECGATVAERGTAALGPVCDPAVAALMSDVVALVQAQQLREATRVALTLYKSLH